MLLCNSWNHPGTSVEPLPRTGRGRPSTNPSWKTFHSLRGNFSTNHPRTRGKICRLFRGEVVEEDSTKFHKDETNFCRSAPLFCLELCLLFRKRKVNEKTAFFFSPCFPFSHLSNIFTVKNSFSKSRIARIPHPHGLWMSVHFWAGGKGAPKNTTNREKRERKGRHEKKKKEKKREKRWRLVE
jgi:hypothetical protein